MTLDSNIEKCPICLDNINNIDQSYNLDCNHSFHTKCIVKWFRSNNKTCPICRDMPKENNFQTEIENIFTSLHGHENVPIVSDILQLENHVTSRQYNIVFFTKIYRIIYNSIPLTSKLKFIFFIFLSSFITTFTTPIIASWLIFTDIYDYIKVNLLTENQV